MTTKRYEFTGEAKEVYGVTLKQIRRLIDGEVGGWIKGEECLPQEGSGWVYPNAMMYGGEMYGGEMHGGKMWGGVMHGGEMYGGVMCGGKMWGGVMHGGEMHGGVMHGGVMHGGVMCGGKMWGGVMHGGEMHGGVMHGGVMHGGVMHGGVMWGGVMHGGVMHGREMHGGVMHGGVMYGGEIHKGMVVTRDPIFIVLPKHNITVADNMAAVGCEVHDFAHWRENIEKIGKKHRYSEEDIAFYKGMLFLAMDRMEAKNAEDAKKKGQKTA